ncbi:MAG: sn-glycerol-3-phosphate ABC transporter ATP-binding protein UgpC [Anaeromyxobacter sp.]|nr:sn-glycerol-3-phosphate ABC transporter ATP-binding protein UgpC [Anaeromyxobacter sp.]MBL0275835.1 sn-glycerol-3-phosphate ABC transporter ATP-binding protein UgpC [Anaeromyxobacter sp.]
MAAVVLKDVTKRFGEVSVIEGLDLEVKDREFMVLVGPSGCGKSTALRMVAGLEETTGGTISIGDRVVNDVPPKDRDIAMVFQSYALYPHMTVRQNLEFGLKIRKTPAAEMARLIGEAVQILGIEPLLDRKPKELSGGQRQRVALGRAIVRKPSVFLFDEPLSNLDAKLRVQMRAEIKKLQARLQVTAIYVTHDQVEAMTMGHRIAVLHAGKLQQVGAPLELYERPANLFVAAFIGSPPMTFVDATVAEGGTRLVTRSFTLPTPAALRATLAGQDGLKVVAGIRPENLAAPGRAPRGEAAPLTITVEIAEPLGDEVVVHARSGEEPLVFKQDPHRPVASGDTFEVQLELDALHLFDAGTERRLGA